MKTRQYSEFSEKYPAIDGIKKDNYSHFYDTVILPTNTDFVPYYNKIKELYNGTIYDCTVDGYLTMFEKKII